MRTPTRRELLASTALTLIAIPRLAARAMVIKGELPAVSGANNFPEMVQPGPWRYFTAEEGAAVEALVDRLIPPDPQTPGGRQAGCAVYIDRQLAGPYGSFQGLYLRPPFHEGSKQQGPQSALTPAQHYRQALAALDRHCRISFANAAFRSE